MTKRRPPSMRWRSEHGDKIIHRWRWQAAWHAWKINTIKDDGRGTRSPYPCWWGQDYKNGETAIMHWHVGRPTTNHAHGYTGRWPGYSPGSQIRNKV